MEFVDESWYKDPTIYKLNGSSAAKIQAYKTRHPWQVYARCGAKITASIRWVRNGDTGVVETPGRRANLVGIKNNFPGGVLCKSTPIICPGRTTKNFWRFCTIWSGTWKPNEQIGIQEHEKTAGTPQLTNKILDSLEGYLDNIAAAAIKTAANGGLLVELAASMVISVDTVARYQQEIKCLME